LEVLQHKGFLERWIQWIQNSLSTGTSSVLSNGTPSKTFHCRKGVRHGDSLSPLLFVLAADLLQNIVNKARMSGLLRLSIDLGHTDDFPIVQYADDTLLIMEACPQQLLVLKSILNTFAYSTGLKMNYSKSSMFPINIFTERLNHLISINISVQGQGIPLYISWLATKLE
jgi:hypothetical protein